jgi:hypothetical protein
MSNKPKEQEQPEEDEEMVEGGEQVEEDEMKYTEIKKLEDKEQPKEDVEEEKEKEEEEKEEEKKDEDDEVYEEEKRDEGEEEEENDDTEDEEKEEEKQEKPKETTTTTTITTAAAAPTTTTNENSKEKKPKKEKKVSKKKTIHQKIGLIIPVGRTKRYLRELIPSTVKISERTPVALASCIEYLLSEVLESSINSKNAVREGMKKLIVNDIEHAFNSDSGLYPLKDVNADFNPSIIFPAKSIDIKKNRTKTSEERKKKTRKNGKK